MKIKIYADGASFKDIKYYNNSKKISGLTTNPSLMRKSGVRNYTQFAKKVLKVVKKKSISFEVFADEPNEMHEQAIKISKWGKNVFVKIPIMNTKGKSTCSLIKDLSNQNIKLNITAIFTKIQLKEIHKHLNKKTPAIISIFAGRIADTGRNPIEIMKFAKKLFSKNKHHEILWASTRELFNIFEAEKAGIDIITVPHSLLKKMQLLKKNLYNYSKETVIEFYNDAKKSRYKL
jgi:transaldolase